ncbi:MAG: glycosyltransferase family 4 protein [Candidatus Nitrospinota bacterium M3_3B_026]
MLHQQGGINARDPEKPIRLVHCSFAAGIGGGVERMDTLYHRRLDRGLFDPVFVVTESEKPGQARYDPSIPRVFTGGEKRFAALIEIFSEAEVAQFSGGFDPLVCEAARLARVPVLVELMHLVEPGQMYPEIDVSICVSETVRRAQPDPERAVVIHNGVDIEDFPFRNEPKGEGGIILVEPSRREKPKHFHLDELAGDIPGAGDGIQIWMAGRGQEGASTDGVTFLGLRTDMAALFRRADLMVLLSKKEPFGLVALEAMASGCLPIVSDDGGMAEIVTHGKDGWVVDASDRASAVRVIREAISLHGSDRWEKMRRAARETVEKRFTAERMIKEYERVYVGLLEKKGRRAAPGPKSAQAPPEAMVGEMVHRFNIGDWEGIGRIAGEFSENRLRLRIPRVADAAVLLARQAAARGFARTADLVYGKLYDSGYRGGSWMKEWLSVMTGEDGLVDTVAEDLLALSPADEQVVMFCAERALKAGRVDRALKTLEEGERRSPGSAQIGEALDVLRRKLGGS